MVNEATMSEQIRQTLVEIEMENIRAKSVAIAKSDPGFMSEYIFDFKNSRHHDEWYGLLSNRAVQVKDPVHPNKPIVRFLKPEEPDAKNNWIMVEAPRDHSKSTVFTVNYPLAEIGKDHNVRIVIASNAADTSEGFVRQIRTIIARNKKYRQTFGRLKPERPTMWRDDAFIVDRDNYKDKDPTVSAVSYGGQVVSKRADIIIVDDLLTIENTRTKEQRAKLKDWFWTVLFPLLKPGGRLIVVGTAWNTQDLYEELLGDVNFDVRLRYDAIVDEKEKTTLWPARWSWDEMMKRKGSMGTLAFNRSYRNITANPEDSPFEENWIQRALKRGERRKLLRTFDYASWDLGHLTVSMGVDLAISKKDKSDFTAMAIIGRTTNGMKIPLYLLRRKLSPAETRRTIKELASIYNPDVITVESNAYQASIQMDLAEETDLPIEAYSTGGEKYDEEIGINSIAVEFENDKWILPYASDDLYTTTMVDHLVQGMRDFTPEKGEHTEDLLMALWMANGGMRRLTVGNRRRRTVSMGGGRRVRRR